MSRFSYFLIFPLFLFFSSFLFATSLEVSQPKTLEVYQAHEEESDSQSIVVYNSSKQDFLIENISLDSPFTFEKMPTVPLRLIPGQKIQWRVRFTSRSCEKQINDNKQSHHTGTLFIGGRPINSYDIERVVIPLLGLCKQGAFLDCDIKEPLFLIEQKSGTSSAPLSFSCTNSGDELIPQQTWKLQGEHAPFFSISPNIISLQPGQKQEFSVQFLVPPSTKENLYRASLHLNLGEKEPVSFQIIGLYSSQSLLGLNQNFLKAETLAEGTIQELSFCKNSVCTDQKCCTNQQSFLLFGMEHRKIVQFQIEGAPTSWFQIEPSSGSLSPQEPLEVFIHFSPDSKVVPQKINALLKIKTEQPEELTIPIYAQIFEQNIQKNTPTPGKKTYLDNEPPMQEEKPSRIALSSEMGIGVLQAPTLYPIYSPQGFRYYPSKNSISQVTVSTQIGASIKMFAGCSPNGVIDAYFPSKPYCWNILFNLQVGGGYLSGYQNPFFEIRPGFEGQAFFGRQHIWGTSLKINLGYMYRAIPSTDAPVLSKETPINPSEYLSAAEHFVSYSIGPGFLLNLDKWTHTKGFQLYVDTLYTVNFSKTKNSNFPSFYELYNHSESGFETKVGFRRWF